MSSSKVKTEYPLGFEHLKDTNLEDIFKGIDTDKSGLINYTEFIASTIDQKIFFREERLFAAFSMFDTDKNGRISLSEVKKALKVKPEDENKIMEIFKSIDINSDGEIDF